MFHTFQTPSPAKSSLLLPQNSGIFQKVGGTFRIPQAALPSQEWKTTVFAVEGNRIHIGLLGSFQQNHHEDLTSKPKSCSGVPQPTPHSVLTASQTRSVTFCFPTGHHRLWAQELWHIKCCSWIPRTIYSKARGKKNPPAHFNAVSGPFLVVLALSTKDNNKVCCVLTV